MLDIENGMMWVLSVGSSDRREMLTEFPGDLWGEGGMYLLC